MFVLINSLIFSAFLIDYHQNRTETTLFQQRGRPRGYPPLWCSVSYARNHSKDVPSRSPYLFLTRFTRRGVWGKQAGAHDGQLAIEVCSTIGCAPAFRLS